MGDRAPAADALLTVDVQCGFVHGPHAVPAGPDVLRVVNALVARAHAAGAPVIHLQNDGPQGAPDEPHTEGWELAFTPTVAATVLSKRDDSAFAGTSLEQLLRERGVSRIVVVGVQSEMCVAANARDALARGWEVVVPRDGHATYAVPADGQAPAVPAELVARVAEWSLGDGVTIVPRGADIRFVPPVPSRRAT